MTKVHEADPNTRKRGRGRPRTVAHLDIWFGVEDAKERKRIQDRLAQRARRKRLGLQQSHIPRSSGKADDELVEEMAYHRLAECQQVPWEIVSFSEQAPDTIESNSLSPKTTNWSQSWSGPTSPNFTVSLDHYFLCWAPWAIYSALINHGIMLGTDCSNCVEDAATSQEFMCLPGALKPTSSQLVIPHRRWIDRFPFPRMRDNMIYLRDLIDLDDFCNDLFNSASFVLRTSCPTWDPKSWTIGPEFASKWGYLFL